MATKLERDIEILKSDIGKFRDHLGTMMSNMGSMSQEKLSETRDRMKSAMNNFGSAAHNRMSQINESVCSRCGSAVRASREAAARKPFTTMVISFSAGAIAAALIGRRNHG